MIHPVVMAGGRGERFWPYSNSKHPKQLLPLVTSHSMLEDTLRNIRAFQRRGKIRLIIGKNLEVPVKAKVRGLAGVQRVAEPQSRNTAAAIALAARLIQREDPQGVMLVLTADHAIGPAREFARALRAAAEVARRGDCLVVFGIRPTRPDTGYGYIETGSTAAESVQGLDVRKIIRFHEKPSPEYAQAYVESGDFLWNSGMFAWRVDYLWEQFRRHLPHTAQAFEAEGDLNPRRPTFAAKLKRIYRNLEDVSIDYGLLEKSESIAAVIPAFAWDDIGSWSSLDRLHAPDEAGNRSVGQALLLESRGNTCFSDGLVCTFGVDNLLVVQHNGVTVVADKSRIPHFKQLVKKVQENPRWKQYL